MMTVNAQKDYADLIKDVMPPHPVLHLHEAAAEEMSKFYGVLDDEAISNEEKNGLVEDLAARWNLLDELKDALQGAVDTRTVTPRQTLATLLVKNTNHVAKEKGMSVADVFFNAAAHIGDSGNKIVNYVLRRPGGIQLAALYDDVGPDDLWKPMTEQKGIQEARDLANLMNASEASERDKQLFILALAYKLNDDNNMIVDGLYNSINDTVDNSPRLRPVPTSDLMRMFLLARDVQTMFLDDRRQFAGAIEAMPELNP